MKVVVTGGAGFIGSHTCRTLLKRAEISQVVAFDDLSTGLRSNLNGVDVEIIEGSVVDGPAISAALVGAVSVIHLAAVPSVPRSIKEPRASHEANASGTLNVLEAAREAGAQVISASSSSVYGANPTLPKVESLASRPLSPYAASKLAAESYTIAWGHSYKMRTLAFRFFNVYGPLQRADHDYAAVIPIFIDAVMNDRPIPVDGDGLQSRDFTYVGTVAQVLADAVVRSVTSPEPINLALGTRTSLLALISELEMITGHSLTRVHRRARAGDVPHSQADSRALQALFPAVSAVPLSQGIRATWQWFEGGYLDKQLPGTP